jgi:hypothetical protein
LDIGEYRFVDYQFVRVVLERPTVKPSSNLNRLETSVLSVGAEGPEDIGTQAGVGAAMSG